MKTKSGIRFGITSLAACLSFTAIAVSAKPPVIIPVTDLGTLGGSTSSGYGVNDAGQVAGTSLMPGDKASHGFLYADGKMTDLGTLGGAQSEAVALNDAGQVTGNADIKTKDKRHAFLWQQGHMSDLGTSRADSSDGLAINRAGQVAGRILRGRFGIGSACRWTQGKVDDLDDAGLGSESDALNNKGQVAGTQRRLGRHTTKPVTAFYFSDHAVLWQGRKASDLEAALTETSLANALNDSGQVAGAALTGPDGLLHACIWQEGRRTDLGTLSGENTVVYAINSAGLMVGGTNPDGMEENGHWLGDADLPQHAFCCSGGRLVNLNSLLGTASGWRLLDARGISDTGYVTGTGVHNGQTHAYLLKLPPGF